MSTPTAEPPLPRAHDDTASDAARANAPRFVLPFEGVYREHLPFVIRTLHRFAIPHAEVEDTAHEVFLIVHRRLADYDATRGSLRSWLWGICRGVAANRRRKDQRRSEREHLVPVPLAPPTPEQGASANEAARLVAAFLEDLDPQRRVVFELIEIEGLRGPEVAELLELNVNSVYTRLRAARLAFKNYVARLRTQKGGA